MKAATVRAAITETPRRTVMQNSTSAIRSELNTALFCAKSIHCFVARELEKQCFPNSKNVVLQRFASTSIRRLKGFSAIQFRKILKLTNFRTSFASL